MDFEFKYMKELLPNRHVVFDTEANGLLDTVTKLYVIVAQDFYTHEFAIFTDEQTAYPVHGSLLDGIHYMISCASSTAHAYMSYDYHVFEKFYPEIWNRKTVPLKKTHDTYVQSKTQWFDRPHVKGVKGNHGLESYGVRFNYPKPPIEDWSFWDDEKMYRCLADVEINRRTLVYLQNEKKKLAAIGVDTTWQTNVIKYTQYRCTKQEQNGFKANVEMLWDSVKTLDKLIKDLVDEIEPQLPKVMKVKSLKCTWEELAEKWNKDSKTPWLFKAPAKVFEEVKKKGEIVKQQVKEAYPPTIKIFLKNGNYDAHTAAWFDVDTDPTVSDFLVQGPHTKVYYEDATMSQHEVVKKFLLTLGWVPIEFNYKTDVHGNDIKDEKGNRVPSSPKLTEASFDSIPEGVGKKIAQYNTYVHRRRTMLNEKNDEKGWINQIRDDGRLACGSNAFATSTGRHAQFGFVNCPSPAALFGEHMRKPWVAEKGHYLVSTDMDSAQLRLLANYMEDDEFTLAVTEGEEFKMYPPNEKPEKYCEVMDDGWYKVYVGTDAHTFNMRYFTLATDDEWLNAIDTQDIDLIHSLSNRRKKSKNGIYCLLFGGGNDKFARTLGYADSRKGKKIKDAYFTRLPKIKKLIDRLEAQFNSHAWNGGGYIQVAGGAWVWSNSKHKLLNYLLMGSEAMVQNVAIVWKNDQYERQNIQSKQVLTVHDEQTDECPVEYVEQVKDVMTQMYGKASEILKLKVAVTGTAVSGGCYLDVH